MPLVPPHENTHNFKMLSTIELLEKYIPNHLLQSIADATSTNIMANTGKPMVLTSTKVQSSKFFVVTLVMSYLKYPRIRMYWQRKTQVSQVADNMARTKYFIIRNNLRVREYADVPDQEKDSDKFWKVAPLINAVRAGCLSNPRDKQVSMDKQMMFFWGHAATRQFVRGKPNPCGLKNFVVCSSDGLPLDFFLYEGKGDSILPNNELNYPKLDIGGKVIVRLTQNLPKGTSIFMDRYFTSIDLLDELHLRGFPGTGTLQKNRIPACAPLYSDAELRVGGRGHFCQLVREDGQMCI